jgi:transposase-like protein
MGRTKARTVVRSTKTQKYAYPQKLDRYIRWIAVGELAREYGVQRNQIAQWRKQALAALRGMR